MGKKKTQIQIKQENKEAALLALQKALGKAKAKAKSECTGTSKRKDNSFLMRYVRASFYPGVAIRHVDEYTAKSYNLAKQVLGLVDHAFVRYSPPLFLYRSILSREGIRLVFAQDVVPESCFEDLFATAARGGSLAKLLTGQLTKKEVHWFLQAPSENTIELNLFWAKFACAGVPLKMCQFLTERLGSPRQQLQIGARLDDLVRFYATSHPFMREAEMRELTDFVAAMVAQREFSFRGRTYGSMRKLSQEWHNENYSGRVSVYQSWPQTYEPWETKVKGARVRLFELTSNRALGDEGNKQKHCVFGYTQMCLGALCRIVSMRWVSALDDFSGQAQEYERITMEIRTRDASIVQIRGRLNRRATDEEMKVIRLWAGEKGLTIAEGGR